MNQPLVVYNGTSAIYIGQSAKHPGSTEKVELSNKGAIHGFLNQYFDEDPAVDLLLTGYDPATMISDFITYFVVVDAAGGLVCNESGNYLFIKRHGIWDLPKGKLHQAEPPDVGAIREVSEETGVGKLEIDFQLPSTFHIYPLADQMVLKRTFWFSMNSPYDGPLTPQMEEDITHTEWLKPADARSALKQSYRSLWETLHPYII